jgi:isopropylmalate/homocitrate/citramalate synthase
MKKRSAHLTRVLIESIYSYSPYRGAKLTYARDYDPSPQINVDLITKIDLEKAISDLHKRREISEQELQMLRYVMADGRLSRRDISAMIQKEEGYYVDQRTISRRLESAYWKISRELGFEYSDSRMFQIIAKKMGKPEPYILNDDEIEKVQQIFERV